jgi:hypothetical protein
VLHHRTTSPDLLCLFCCLFLFLFIYIFLVVLGFELRATLARQMLCHLSHSTSPFFFI